MTATFAMVFPGQGAQAVGMVDALASEFPWIRQRFVIASDVLGYDLWHLVTSGPAEILNQTQYTQPALLAASVATWDVWQELGGTRPVVMAGHSFGEYSALVCAEVLDYRAAVALVATRGRLMQGAVAPGDGAMAAVLGLDAEAVAEVCRDAAEGEVVECANLNAPGQVVISGAARAVARAGELAKSRGAKRSIPLAVSVPAHCALMAPVAAEYAAHVDALQISPPRIPVLHNVDVMPHTTPEEIKAALIAQLAKPVRWQQTVEKFPAFGVTHVLECGPGKVLGPLVKRCASQLATLSAGTPDELRAALAVQSN
jgi:[acyl-carrier-protein] S-malonyltransferase